MSRVLFLSAWYPYPPNNGSKLRIFHLLRGLSSEHDVTLLCFAEGGIVPDVPPGLASICRRVEAFPGRAYESTSVRAMLGTVMREPRVLADLYSPRMEHAIRHAIERERPDVVITSEWQMAAYSSAFDDVPAILDDAEYGVMVDRVEHARNALARWRHRLTLLKLGAYLRRLLPRFAAVTVVSDAELALLRWLAPDYGSIYLVPNCVDASSYGPQAETNDRATLVFTGPFRYRVNHEAMEWYLQDVHPRVQSIVPHAQVLITGDHLDLPLPEVSAVVRTGHVEDVAAVIRLATASIVPLRQGGGTRLKILEAMAIGTPVVSTSKGAQGLDLRAGEELLVADTAAGFAEATVLLLCDPGFRNQLADRARARIRSSYDWQVVMPTFLDLVRRVAAGEQLSPEMCVAAHPVEVAR